MASLYRHFPTFFLLLLRSSWSVSADKLVDPDYTLQHLVPDIACLNNGVARFITKDPYDLRKRMQSGKVVQECICPMGFRGMSCEVVEENHPSACGDAAADPLTNDCDCAVADYISPFAAQQCRKPFTEYCAALRSSVGGHVAFCTNSGKCKGDVIAAGITPGNTTMNYVFQHAGCLCPPEFKGEHCELLNENFVHAAANKISQSTTSNNNNNTDVAKCVAFALVSLAVVALILGVRMKVKSRRDRYSESAALNVPPLVQPPCHHNLVRTSRYCDDPAGDDGSSSDGSEDEEYKEVSLEIT